MSAIRIQFFVVLVLPGMSFSSAAAQNSGKVQEFREWAADVVRGYKSSSLDSHPGNSSVAGPETMIGQFVGTGRGFLGQVGRIIDQRIGWLRPSTIKEKALIWMALAMALPWGFVIWLRPSMQEDILEFRLPIVAVWTGGALCTAWYSWGAASGADRFASSMLFGVPWLIYYFNSIIRSVAGTAKI